MSKSRSTTPTPDTFSTNLNPSLDSTTSRTPPHVHFPSQSILLEGDQSQSSHSPQIYSLLPPSQSTPSSSTDRMTRQLQRKRTISRPVAEYSASYDSQKNVEGTSTGDGSSQSAASPKKKRTRTLTTPHQAAVLHALLAKSRFPNTAVREEVGRSIGLSARKVQVWFQNQRQKARRPHSQSDTSRKKSPQFGAFPSGSSAMRSLQLAPEPSSSYSASTLRSAEMGRSVARPGMPGLEPSSDLTYRGQRIPSRPSTASEGFIRYSDLRDRSMRSIPMPLYLPPPVPHTATTSRPYEHDPSRTLPPLVFPSAPPRPSFSASGPASGPSRAAFDPSYRERRSLSPVDMFSYQPPESAPLVTWPPYVAPPQLHWPIPSFEPTLRSSHSPSWALQEHGPASRSVTPPVAATARPPTAGVATTEDDIQPTETRPPRRSGRYDPIRGTFIYSSPPEDH